MPRDMSETVCATACTGTAARWRYASAGSKSTACVLDDKKQTQRPAIDLITSPFGAADGEEKDAVILP